MAYLHILNLYKDQTILLFREAYALEKIHGTSAHVAWNGSAVRFFSGGEKHERFAALFDADALVASFTERFGETPVTVYGEAYGGKCQGMSATYGKELRFVVFEVRVGEHCWLEVPKAEAVAGQHGLEFVHYRKVSTDLEALDAERDAPSEQARRNGIEGEPIREGVVLRPLVEVRLNNGDRVIAKHKREEFRERRSIPSVDPTKRELLERAGAIADEWVTPRRLDHVLDKLRPPATELSDTGRVIKAMVEDVCREASGEIVESKDARKAIGKRAARLFRERVTRVEVSNA